MFSFTLNSRAVKDGKRSIRLYWRIKGSVFNTTIPISIPPEEWCPDFFRVTQKFNNRTLATEGININAFITKIENALNEYQKLLPDGKIPTREEMKIVVRSAVRGYDVSAEKESQPSPETAPKKRDIFKDIDEFLEDGKKLHHFQENTAKKIGTLKNHFKGWNENVNYNSFTHRGLDSYVIYLSSQLRITDTTIRSDLKKVRWFLAWAEKRGYTTVSDWKTYKFNGKENKRDLVFLTKNEIGKLIDCKIPEDGAVIRLEIDGKWKEVTVGHDKMPGHNTLQHVKDMFLFQCFTALRWSDLQNLQKTDTDGEMLNFSTIKTGDHLINRVPERGRSILLKYANYDPWSEYIFPRMSNQKANTYLKLLGQIAGLHDIVHITEYRDNRRIDMALPKYKCLSTHAGRRTFVTSAIAAGIPPTVVMSFTGHKTYAVMERYIGIASDTKDKAMEDLDSYLR